MEDFLGITAAEDDAEDEDEAGTTTEDTMPFVQMDGFTTTCKKSSR